MATIVKVHILGKENGETDTAGQCSQFPDDSWHYCNVRAWEQTYNLDNPVLLH